MKTDILLKVSFEGCTYLIDEFPADYKDMVKKISTKLNKQLGREFTLSFIDCENEKIVFSDDSDLAYALKMTLADNKKSLKVLLEKTAPEKGSGSERNTLTSSEEALSVAFDPQKYFKFLEHNLPKCKRQFEEAIDKHKLPCEDCFGAGLKKNATACENCNRTGHRPVTSQMKLILKLMDYKLKKFIMEPLRLFIGGEDTEKESERILDDDSEELDDLFNKELQSANRLSKSSNKLISDNSTVSRVDQAKPDSGKRSTQQQQILPSTVINPQRKSSGSEDAKLDFLGSMNKTAPQPKEAAGKA